MDVPPEVAEWIALLDAAERLQRDDASYDERSSVVAAAIERLYAYEDAMTLTTRQLARERLWQRDFPDTPLPEARSWWSLCQCRRCAITRRLAHARRQPTAYDVQRAVLHRQRRSSS